MYVACVIAGGIAVAEACYVTISPVCTPAGTIIAEDASISYPCHQVTCEFVTGADAYYPDVQGVDCGGSTGTVPATFYNTVPVEEIGAVGTGTSPTNGVCTITTGPAGTTTITCNGTAAAGAACTPCGG